MDTPATTKKDAQAWCFGMAVEVDGGTRMHIDWVGVPGTPVTSPTRDAVLAAVVDCPGVAEHEIYVTLQEAAHEPGLCAALEIETDHGDYADLMIAVGNVARRLLDARVIQTFAGDAYAGEVAQEYAKDPELREWREASLVRRAQGVIATA